MTPTVITFGLLAVASLIVAKFFRRHSKNFTAELEANVLECVQESPGCSRDAISRRVGYDPAPTVRNLVKHGLLDEESASVGNPDEFGGHALSPRFTITHRGRRALDAYRGEQRDIAEWADE